MEEDLFGLLPLPGSFRPKGFSLNHLNNTLYLYGGYHSQSQKLCILKDLHKITNETLPLEWETKNISQAISRAAHVSFVSQGMLYLHGGYGSNKDTSQFQAFSTMETIHLDTFETKRIQYTKVVPNIDRRWHCGFVSENKFFIHGGWNDGGPISDLSCLDLDAMAWEIIPLQENVPPARRWHTLTSLPNTKKHLLFGGYNGDFQNTFGDTHILDLNRGTWITPQMKGDLPPPRINHVMEHIGNKCLFLLGGRDQRKENCQDSYVLTLDDMKWHKVKNSGDLFCVNRSGHKMMRVGEHGLVVAGGNAAKYIDPFYYLDTRMLKY